MRRVAGTRRSLRAGPAARRRPRRASATPVECSRSQGDLRPGESGESSKAGIDPVAGEATWGNGSLSSACCHIRVSSSSANTSSKWRTASSARRGSYAAAGATFEDGARVVRVGGGEEERVVPGHMEETRRQRERLTPTPPLGPLPSQRAKTYSSAASTPGPSSSQRAKRWATSHIAANDSRALPGSRAPPRSSARVPRSAAPARRGCGRRRAPARGRPDRSGRRRLGA